METGRGGPGALGSKRTDLEAFRRTLEHVELLLSSVRNCRSEGCARCSGDLCGLVSIATMDDSRVM